MKPTTHLGGLDLIASAIEQINSGKAAFTQILQGHFDNFDYQKIINLTITGLTHGYHI